MEITPEELKYIKAALDFMEDAITDVVGWANKPGDKIYTMHQVKRVHELSVEKIKEIWDRREKNK